MSKIRVVIDYDTENPSELLEAMLKDKGAVLLDHARSLPNFLLPEEVMENTPLKTRWASAHECLCTEGNCSTCDYLKRYSLEALGPVMTIITDPNNN